MSTFFLLATTMGHCATHLYVYWLYCAAVATALIAQNFKSQSFVTTFLCLKLCLRVPETKHLLSLLRLCSSVTVLNYRIVTFFYGMSLIKIISIELETIFWYVGKLKIYNILVYNIFCNINFVQLVNHVSTYNIPSYCLTAAFHPEVCSLCWEKLLFDVRFIISPFCIVIIACYSIFNLCCFIMLFYCMYCSTERTSLVETVVSVTAPLQSPGHHTRRHSGADQGDSSCRCQGEEAVM